MRRTWLVGGLMLLVLTGCWNNRELDQLAIVVGLGIDKAGQADQYRVSMQIVNPGAMAVGQKSGGTVKAMPITLYAETGSSIFEAMRKAANSVPLQPFFAHTQIIIIGEELAREGFSNLFDFYERSREFRMNAQILIAKEAKAEQVLSMFTPLENVSASGIMRRLEFASDTWGQSHAMTIKELIQTLVGESEPAISGIRIQGDPALGASSKNEEETKVPSFMSIDGIGLFKEGKLISWLDGPQARGTVFLLDELKGTSMSLPCDDKPEGAAIELLRSSTSTQVEVKHGRPLFRIKVEQEGSVNELQCPMDISKKETLVKLQQEWAAATEKEIVAAVQAAKQAKSDIFQFGIRVGEQHPELWKEWKEEWPDIFAESLLEVEVEAFIRRTGMRMKPYTVGGE
ncbi:Ger(x)C family spore germination protein [Xylanibacillus composti]|uniref:Spore germination protein KC n=1 Tax=Xylanibacillus composti TaxID=1572762 RepID=A0A8J4M2P7_9BACL|nr:Ger(x)C family spore germination protein [Xylanibacillus composti]MDT9726102.1 Ger(x)C family spore germination protein [Xylanibacillus composti]GIQ68751.1 spore germination protein KC [Xylanibacillus composti]